MILLELHITHCKVFGNIPEETYKIIQEKTSYLHNGYMFSYAHKNSGWDGYVRLFKNNSFPIGLLPRIKYILEKQNVHYNIADKRPAIDYGDSLVLDPKSGFEAREYQSEIADKCFEKGMGVVKAATGSGKTFTLGLVVGKYNIKTMIYVIGVELLYQMKSTLERMYPNLEIGLIGDGHCDVKDINIATIWSAASAFNKKIDVLDADLTYDKKDIKNKLKVQKAIKEAQMFILDECQYAAANTVQFIHKASINAKHRFLFSASPWRDSGDEILIEAVGGNRIYDLPASNLIETGYLVRPEIHFLDVPVMRKVGKTYQEVYSNYIVNNDTRNDMIISAAKKLISSGKKVLILVVRVGHGNTLLKKMKDDYRVDFLDGQNTSKQRLETINRMKSGEIDVLIASKIFDQGVDIPQLDALILAGSGKSSGRALQRIGRVIRKHKGKDRAIVVDFYDNAKYLRDHSEVRKKVYETEPSFIIKFPKLKEYKKYPKKKKIDWSS